MPEWQGFYPTLQAARLTGVPADRLWYWDRKRILRRAVEIAGESDTDAVNLGYSYNQLAIIRMLRDLRERGFRFRNAITAINHLLVRLGPPDSRWADALVGVDGRDLFVVRPDEWGATDASRGGQRVLLGSIVDELQDLEPGTSFIVPPAFRKDVQINPEVMSGEPVIWGTRIPTASVPLMLSEYRSMDKVSRLLRRVPREKLIRADEYERFLTDRAA
jgi:uncharacterized protein (DUF433 family)